MKYHLEPTTDEFFYIDMFSIIVDLGDKYDMI